MIRAYNFPGYINYQPMKRGYVQLNTNEYFANNSFFGGDFMNYQPQRALTIMCWLKPDSSTGNKTICARYNPGSGFFVRGFRFNTMASLQGIEFWVGESSANIIHVQSGADTVRFTANQWVHCIMTYDGSELAAGVRFWFNGFETTPTVVADTYNSGLTITYTDTTFLIGARQNSLVWNGTITTPMNGAIKDLRIIDGYALNEVEVNWFSSLAVMPSSRTDNIRIPSVHFPMHAIEDFANLAQILSPSRDASFDFNQNVGFMGQTNVDIPGDFDSVDDIERLNTV